MAFNREKFVGSVNDGLFAYDAGADTKSALQGSGYFGNSVKQGKIVNTTDLILAVASDGVALLLVTDGGGEVDAVIQMEA